MPIQASCGAIYGVVLSAIDNLKLSRTRQWQHSLALRAFRTTSQPMKMGMRIDETGMLLREGENAYLRRDAGGRFLLDLRRVAIDDGERQVRIIGTFVGNDTVDVDAIEA